MNISYLLIGGNIGDRLNNLADARKKINESAGKISALSGIYETDAWGKPDQPAFLNQAIKIETKLDAAGLLKCLLAIEKMLGRTRKEKYGPRVIDIDILLFNDAIINEPSLKIPHPELINRRFALVPLGEIAGSVIHPVFHKTVKELINDCEDKLRVKRIKE